jgi:hypothetical protein
VPRSASWTRSCGIPFSYLNFKDYKNQAQSFEHVAACDTTEAALASAGGLPPIIEINRELVKKVEELKLQVETLVAVHSGVVAWKDFRRAVTDASQK